MQRKPCSRATEFTSPAPLSTSSRSGSTNSPHLLSRNSNGKRSRDRSAEPGAGARLANTHHSPMEPITAAIAAILAANRSKPKLYVKTDCPGVLPSDRVSGSPRHRLRSSRRHRQPAGMQEMVRISGQHCDVLKLIGDGVLAIFRTPDAAACTLRAARAVKRNGAELSARRQREGRPVTGRCALACT